MTTTRKRADGGDSGVPVHEPEAPKHEPYIYREPPTNVIAAIARVEAEIGGIVKLNPIQRAQLGMGGGDEQGIKYPYRGIDQIAQAAQPLFGKYGVIIVPTVLARETETITTQRGGSMSEHFVTVRWDLYGPGGVADTIQSTTEGEARDSGDKGVNKAMTAAYKNLLLRILCIGDPQDDTDNFNTADGEPVQRRNGTPPAVNAPPASADELAALVATLKPSQKNALNRYAGTVLGVKNLSEPGELTGAMAQAARNVIAGREPGQGPPVAPAEPEPADDAQAAVADAQEPVQPPLEPAEAVALGLEPPVDDHEHDFTPQGSCRVPGCTAEEPF